MANRKLHHNHPWKHSAEFRPQQIFLKQEIGTLAPTRASVWREALPAMARAYPTVSRPIIAPGFVRRKLAKSALRNGNRVVSFCPMCRAVFPIILIGLLIVGGVVDVQGQLKARPVLQANPFHEADLLFTFGGNTDQDKKSLAAPVAGNTFSSGDGFARQSGKPRTGKSSKVAR